MKGVLGSAAGASDGSDRSEGWSDRWFRFRNRVFSSPAFQRWAARFPLTRWIARRRAAALFDLCAGFVYSQVLHAGVRLGLFELLREEPLTATVLAERLGLRPEPALRLLDAAVSLQLLERRPRERYGLGVHGAALLGNPAVAAMVEHHALLYRDLADPVALLRGELPLTELQRFWSYAGQAPRPASPEGVAAYSQLMAASISLVASDLLEAYPFARHRRLLDLAGGEGAFLEAVAARAPALALTLFDLPPVAARAAARLARAGLSARASVVAGDLFADPLPTGADLISLVRVIHDHDDAQALRILRAARAALAPGGVLLLAEPMARTAGAEPMGDAYFGFYLLAMGQGRPRTAERLAALLLAAGFAEVTPAPTPRPLLVRLIIARG